MTRTRDWAIHPARAPRPTSNVRANLSMTRCSRTSALLRDEGFPWAATDSRIKSKENSDCACGCASPGESQSAEESAPRRIGARDSREEILSRILVEFSQTKFWL